MTEHSACTSCSLYNYTNTGRKIERPFDHDLTIWDHLSQNYDKNTDAHTKAAQATNIFKELIVQHKTGQTGCITALPQRVHDSSIAPQPQEAVGGGDPVGV